MRIRRRSTQLALRALASWCLLGTAVACSDATDPIAPTVTAEAPTPPGDPPGALPPSDGAIDTDEQLVTLDCVAMPQSGAVNCIAPPATTGSASEPSEVFGTQNVDVRLTSSNASYNSGTGAFSVDVTVQNLLTEAIGTPDGVTPDTAGVRIFFTQSPVATGGSGSVALVNADGVGTFADTSRSYENVPYYEYGEVLSSQEVSGARTWQFSVPSTVTSFQFRVRVAAAIQPLLVINEMLVNPAGVAIETIGDWVELYNAGSRAVQMQGFVIADSAASGRRPYHLISSPLLVPSHGYVVLGGSTNPTANGGVPVDYSWGGSVSLVSSLDAFKVARVYGTDTLTLDRTQYASAATSAQDGVSRELKNPALDNSNMDGSNWASALVTAVYGPGGRGTPKAMNSTFAASRLAEASYRWPGTPAPDWERRRLSPPSVAAARRPTVRFQALSRAVAQVAPPHHTPVRPT
jgi:hypothetical protein